MAAPSLQKTTLYGCVAFIIIAVLGYGIFEARRLIEGPRITVDFPKDGGTAAGPSVAIRGVAENVAFLSINGKQAYTDAEGKFEESPAPASGYTVWQVAATDRFGRVALRTVRFSVVEYCPAG